MAAHGGNVAQAAGKAAVTHGSSRVPSAAKMYVFDAEIGGNQQFRAGGRAQNGAIVPYAANQAYSANQAAGCRRTSKTTNCLDEVSFLNHKSSYNYIKNMNLC